MSKTINIESQLLATREKLKELIDMSKTMNKYYHEEDRQINSWSFTHKTIDIRSSSIICKYNENCNCKNECTQLYKEVLRNDYLTGSIKGIMCPNYCQTCSDIKYNKLLGKSARIENDLRNATKYLEKQKDDYKGYTKNKCTKPKPINIKCSNKTLSVENRRLKKNRARKKRTATGKKKLHIKMIKKLEVKEKIPEVVNLTKATRKKLQDAIDNCDIMRKRFRKNKINKSETSIHEKLDILMSSLKRIVSEVKYLKSKDLRNNNTSDSLGIIKENKYHTSKEYIHKHINGEVNKSLVQNATTDMLKENDKTNKYINISINTEPLGFLELLKLLKEYMKQFIVFIMVSPITLIIFCFRNMLSYRSNWCDRLELCEHSHRCESRNFIGCHDVRVKLFSCKYCGETFMRAYCCQLHQKTCADKFHLIEDERPSLLFLK